VLQWFTFDSPAWRKSPTIWESKRRQYGLVNHAKGLGFGEVEVIDEDLGRSGSGLVERPGFQRLVAMVCEGRVGAVLCIEASRLARNGRDWHHLIELCGLVGALVVDPDGVYDPTTDQWSSSARLEGNDERVRAESVASTIIGKRHARRRVAENFSFACL
jgi:DNA invertase Pin-like site-specific DNA recombinase